MPRRGFQYRKAMRIISRICRAKRIARWRHTILGKNRDWMMLPLPVCCFLLETNGVTSNIKCWDQCMKITFWIRSICCRM